ncbi:hypothetical protein ANANG_G00078610 [Anguilla anguilla]|uniref:Cytosolic carboxypeptidase N-terminal domain-containing protein n=1 Tax=Anguilla anguilla TaxID=7936 RepID=A0A9D3MJK3_ANGAN|nr:hypothetical protein ANANG_G00078610 [Anguilla anguilla]
MLRCAFQRVIFNIVNFSKTKSLYRDGMSPVVKSTSRPKWQRLPAKNVYYYRCPDHRRNYVMSFAFCFDREDDVYQFAYCYPYTYSRLQHYLDSLERRNLDYLQRELLGLSVQQRRLDLLTITNPGEYPGLSRARSAGPSCWRALLFLIAWHRWPEPTSSRGRVGQPEDPGSGKGGRSRPGAVPTAAGGRTAFWAIKRSVAVTPARAPAGPGAEAPSRSFSAGGGERRGIFWKQLGGGTGGGDGAEKQMGEPGRMPRPYV